MAHEGVLNVNQITQSLDVSEHTARKTMLELKILGLVERDTVDMLCEDGIVRKGFEIRLKDEFQWFLSEEFTNLRKGFKASRGEEAREEKLPPHTTPTKNDSNNQNTEINDVIRGGKISSTATSNNPDESETVIPDSIHRAYSETWKCRNCNVKGDKWYMLKHPEHCRSKGGENK